MDRPKLEVADIFRRYGAAYREQHGASMSIAQRRVMTAIEQCRTAALGGHLERCDECGHERNAFNSCRDRHCPKCQSLARAQWIENRHAELLDVPYFHVVFTLPEEIDAITLQNKRVVYNILFQVTAETLRTIAADPRHLGAEIGFFAVLHSWGQGLQLERHQDGSVTLSVRAREILGEACEYVDEEGNENLPEEIGGMSVASIFGDYVLGEDLLPVNDECSVTVGPGDLEAAESWLQSGVWRDKRNFGKAWTRVRAAIGGSRSGPRRRA